MKKVLILACAALTACTNDIDLGPNKEQVETLSNAIGFQMAKKNMTTTKATQTLQSQGHYNFGVWGYKDTDTDHEIMGNYLVGFGDGSKGYKMDATTQTTWGDPSNSKDGQSQWAYEMLGLSEYNNTTVDGFYKITDTKYMSNNPNQYLRYWDLSSARTTFYAYAPYVHSSDPVTFSNSTAGDATKKTMSFPNGSIVMGKDQPADQEFMYAVKKVENHNYKEDVKLVFHRMGARIQIKFWEDIPGYTVKMMNLDANPTGTLTLTDGIYAKPAIAPASGNTYREGKYLTKTGADIVFTNNEANATDPTANVTFKGVTNFSDKCLTFDIPRVQLGETRTDAKFSETKYYMIPRGANFAPAIGDDDDFKKTGFIFHVSYELISTTGEKIIVTDAKVFVPADQCNWLSNKSYTYVFKITKNSNGTTDKKDPHPDNDLTVDTEAALYPIVFDGCMVKDYEEVDVPSTGDGFEITDGTFNYYLNLDKATVNARATADADRTITVSNAHKVNSSSTSIEATDGDIKVYYGASEASTTSIATVTYDPVAKTFSIKVETGATLGEYSIMYCGVKVATFEVTNS